MNLCLMAVLMCGLAMSVSSCKDDDNNHANGGPEVETHVSTGKSFFTLYLSYYVSALREGKGDTLPRERNITGTW